MTGSVLTRRFPWLLFPELLVRRRRGSHAIRDFQDKRLRQLFRLAYSQVPHYRRRFEEVGLNPANFGGLSDLHKIPLGRKSDLAAPSHNPLLCASVSPQNLLLHCTSGTSGHPLRVYRTWHEERMLQLLRRAAYVSLGWNPLLKQAMISQPSVHRQNLPHRILSRFGLLRVRRFSCFKAPQELLGDLAEYRPDMLGGYPESLAAIARVYTQSSWPTLRPRLITCGGGVLTELARGQLQKAFPSLPIYDIYGATEFNLVAWQCPKTEYYHICDDGLVVEVLDEEGRPVSVGERGRLVGTALHSFAMPLIRLPLGDLVVRGPWNCPCGAGFATLKEISGRLSEIMTLAGGENFHPFVLLAPLSTYRADWLHRYRVLQVDTDHLIVEAVVRPIPEDRELTHLRKLLAGSLPAGVRLEIKFVDELPQESTGKFILSVPLPRNPPE